MPDPLELAPIIKVTQEEVMTLEKAIGMIWFRVCRNSTPLGIWIWIKYKRSGFAKGYYPIFLDLARCWASILWHTFRRVFVSA